MIVGRVARIANAIVAAMVACRHEVILSDDRCWWCGADADARQIHRTCGLCGKFGHGSGDHPIARRA